MAQATLRRTSTWINVGSGHTERERERESDRLIVVLATDSFRYTSTRAMFPRGRPPQRCRYHPNRDHGSSLVHRSICMEVGTVACIPISPSDSIWNGSRSRNNRNNNRMSWTTVGNSYCRRSSCCRSSRPAGSSTIAAAFFSGNRNSSRVNHTDGSDSSSNRIHRSCLRSNCSSNHRSIHSCHSLSHTRNHRTRSTHCHNHIHCHNRNMFLSLSLPTSSGGEGAVG